MLRSIGWLPGRALDSRKHCSLKDCPTVPNPIQPNTSYRKALWLLFLVLVHGRGRLGVVWYKGANTQFPISGRGGVGDKKCLARESLLQQVASDTLIPPKRRCMRKSEVGHIWTVWSMELDGLKYLYSGLTGSLCAPVMFQTKQQVSSDGQGPPRKHWSWNWPLLALSKRRSESKVKRFFIYLKGKV